MSKPATCASNSDFVCPNWPGPFITSRQRSDFLSCHQAALANEKSPYAWMWNTRWHILASYPSPIWRPIFFAFVLKCPLPKSTLSSASSWLTGCLWTPSRAAVQRKAIIRPWPAPQLWLQGWPKRTLYDHTSALDVTANINKGQEGFRRIISNSCTLTLQWPIFYSFAVAYFATS